MDLSLILPEEVGAEDAMRVLDFVNGVLEAEALAGAVGFSEGLDIGRAVAAEILATRDHRGGFLALAEILGVTRVTPARFTEIVMALSAARPRRAGGGRSLRLALSPERPWLGQGIAVSLRLLDAAGRGMPGAPVTCVATWGVLAGRAGVAVTRGASVEAVTGAGGNVSLRLDPPLDPPLDRGPKAALEAELVRLSSAEGSVATALRAFAARYRAEASAALRAAVDRLFADRAVEPTRLTAPVPLLPVTLIAVVDEGEGVLALATVRVRDWRGPWLAALRDAVTADERLAEALKHITVEGAKGADLARTLVGASAAVAGLERSRLGQKFRDEIAGVAVNGFLLENARHIGEEGLASVVRAAGASSAAIKGGGLKVFETVRTVQEMPGSRAAGGAVIDAGRLEGLATRIEGLESRAVDRAALEGLRSDLGDQLGRIRADLQRELDAKVDRGAIDARLAALERDLVTRADLAGLQSQLAGKADATTVAGFQSELARLRTETDRLATGVGRRLEALERDRVNRADIAGLESQLAGKADATTVAELGRGLERVRADTMRISSRVDTVNLRLTEAGIFRPGGPNR
jgi:hypothetical protein